MRTLITPQKHKIVLKWMMKWYLMYSVEILSHQRSTVLQGSDRGRQFPCKTGARDEWAATTYLSTLPLRNSFDVV